MGVLRIFCGYSFLKPRFFPGIFCRNNSQFHKFKVSLNMSTVYINKAEDKDMCLVNFLYTDDDFKIKSTLNLNRCLSDSVSTLLDRISLKLDKIYNTKARKKKNKTGKCEIELPPIKPELLLNNQPVDRDTILSDIFSYNDLKLRICKNIFDVNFNVPLVVNISLLKSCHVGVPFYPEKVETLCVNKEKSKYMWFKKSENSDWIVCGEEFYYIPTENDVNHTLKFVYYPANDTYPGFGPASEAVCSFVENNINFKQIKKRHEFTKQPCCDDEFRVVSYNILADSYTTTKEAKESLFTYCNSDILKASYRRKLLLNELYGYNADLICMQEVEKSLFSVHLKKIFCNTFEGLQSTKVNNFEGCALFYRKDKFKLLNFNECTYFKELMEDPLVHDFKQKIEDNLQLIERLKELTTLFQIATFQFLPNKNHLIVLANTHLYFHPNADHIRLLQALIGLRKIQQTANELKKENPNSKVSIIFCGDFNSTPDSGIYKLMTEGSIDSECIDWNSVEEEAIKGVSFNHSLKIKSACGTPEYTNYTKLFKGCLDYIYYQEDHLEVSKFVPFPTEEELSEEIAIPSKFYPSDHLALIADLKFRSQ